jgi:Tol biopolymer transport system component
VWIIDLDRDVPVRFTFDQADDVSPVWTPDGSRIVFQSNRKGQVDLYQRGSGGVGPDEVLNESEGTKVPTSFSPDGRVLLFSRSAGGRSAETWALPMTENAKPVALVSTGFPAGAAVFSPDGRWFAYCEGDSGDQVYVQPYPPNGTRVRLSPRGGSSPQWSADGKRVFFTRADNYVVGVDVVAAGGVLRAGAAEELFLAPGTFGHRALLADSRRGRFLVPVPREQVTAAIGVILNWPALLKQ